jgi:general secretion pathway protein G
MMKRRSAFTLIELVVVVMIIGIIAAIAVPKMINLAGSATDNSAAQTLSVLRSAIETYASQNQGTYPGTSQATLYTALQPYIRGQFPNCPVGAPGVVGTNTVSVVSGSSVLLSGNADATPTCAWKYNYTTGEIIINYLALDHAGVAYDSL